MESLDICNYKDLLRFERSGMPSIAIDVIQNGLRDKKLFHFYNTGASEIPHTMVERKKKFIKYMKDNFPFIRGKDPSFIENLTVSDFRALEARSDYIAYLKTHPPLIFDENYKPFETLPKDFSDCARKNLTHLIGRLKK